jgi:serine/threonine protein kinase
MASELPADSHIAEYRILQLIGRGGMGLVYLAEHSRLGRKVALKVLPPEYAEDEGFRDRFDREARLAASLDHPNIVPVYDAGEHDGRLWIAMRFVQGTDLHTVLAKQGGLHPLRAVSILGRVGSALDAAHSRGLVHRDVKPGNILLQPPSPENPVERVYLTDFGLTKRVDTPDDADRNEGPPGEGGERPHQLTRTGYFVGTLDYAAPEQFRGKNLDGRTDEYALACVLYETLTGKVPFARDSEAAVMFGHMSEPPPRLSALRPGLPLALDAVVARGMAKDPARRFPGCAALIQAAREVIAASPTAPAGAPPQPSSAGAQPSYSGALPILSGGAAPPSSPGMPVVPTAPVAPPPPVPAQPSVGPQVSFAGQPVQGRGSRAARGGAGTMRHLVFWAGIGVIAAAIVVVVLILTK